MSSYNERLDEILQNHFRGYAARSFPEWCQDNASETWDNSVEKAKQALTTLIKELVAEAKPHKRLPDDSPTADEDLVNYGHNEAIDQFEQSLLKELEATNE